MLRKDTIHANFDCRMVINDSLREQITARLSSFERISNSDSKLRQAAVAITVIDSEQNDTAAFLLTRRPKHLNRHGGQYALPGGKRDPDETPIDTALRELHEEIGINLAKESVLGMLDDYQTRSGFNITPVVVWAGAKLKINPDPNEIARVFRIPLDDLKSTEIPVLEQIQESDHPVLSTPLATLGHRVFAPTSLHLSISGSCASSIVILVLHNTISQNLLGSKKGDQRQDYYLFNLFFSALLTSGCTNLETLPPN